MNEVLGNSPLLNTPITAKARIVSPGSCKPYAHTTLRDLLAEMLIDIAHNILHLAGTTEACLADLVGKGPVDVVVAGPTGHLPIIQRTLQAKGIGYDIRKHHDPTRDTKTSRGGSDQVAIVGMGGRFPGSDTIDGFWEDLVAGKIQIEKVCHIICVLSEAKSDNVNNTRFQSPDLISTCTMILQEKRETPPLPSMAPFSTTPAFLTTVYSTSPLVKLRKWIRSSVSYSMSATKPSKWQDTPKTAHSQPTATESPLISARHQRIGAKFSTTRASISITCLVYQDRLRQVS